MLTLITSGAPTEPIFLQKDKSLQWRIAYIDGNGRLAEGGELPHGYSETIEKTLQRDDNFF